MAPAAQQRTARVELVGATVGIAKAGGLPWDVDVGTPPSPSEMEALSLALGATGQGAAAAAVAAYLAKPAALAMAKPDVMGVAALVNKDGQSAPQKLVKVQDSFTPGWRGVAWARVPLDGSMRVRVRLIDSDAVEDDPIGVFELGAKDIEAAIASGAIYHVQVADQTNRQVLFASISAFLE